MTPSKEIVDIQVTVIIIAWKQSGRQRRTMENRLNRYP